MYISHASTSAILERSSWLGPSFMIIEAKYLNKSNHLLSWSTLGFLLCVISLVVYMLTFIWHSGQIMSKRSITTSWPGSYRSRAPVPSANRRCAVIMATMQVKHPHVPEHLNKILKRIGMIKSLLILNYSIVLQFILSTQYNHAIYASRLKSTFALLQMRSHAFSILSRHGFHCVDIEQILLCWRYLWGYRSVLWYSLGFSKHRTASVRHL